jgi:hypothetical protein
LPERAVKYHPSNSATDPQITMRAMLNFRFGLVAATDCKHE